LWENENGRRSVVPLSDIFKNDPADQLKVGTNYKVQYGTAIFNGTLKMIGNTF
jgi:hypothetical protein